MDILNYWGIYTSFTNSDLEKFHENGSPKKNLFYLPILLKVNSLQILLFPNLQNSFLSPTLVSNVGLIDMIIDHRTIITDLKEDDYLFLLQWNGNTISDASWITSHDLLNYAPHLLLNFIIYERHFLGDEVLQPRGNDGELFSNMNTRVLSELILLLLLLIYQFEKLSIIKWMKKNSLNK